MTITYHAGRRIQGLSTDIIETPTQSFDFSSSTGWTQTGSNINISGGKLNWIGDRTVSNNAISYDLGSSANANSWILDFNITLTNYSAGSATYTHKLGIMLSSLGSSSSSNIQRQFIGCDLTWRTVEDALYRKFFAKDDNNNTQTWADNVPYNTPDDSTAHNFPVQGQTYNIKIIKLTSTTYKVEIINTADSAIFDTLTGTCSSTGLQHILIQSYSGSTDGNPAFDGTIDDMKFYNGVSSLTSKPTNVQAGSRFEETDTRKIYYSSKVHTFLLADTGTSFTPSASGNVEYLVIGGGGGAGGTVAGGLGTGGGGAGGYRTASGFPVIAQAYIITVGDGGIGSTTGSGAGADGTTGNSSTFSTITSAGGGGGGGYSNAGKTGGSGGGGYNAGGAGNTPSTSPSQGNTGGISVGNIAPNYGGGGGGGSSAVGNNGTGAGGGNGGAGTASSISGSSITRAGGGGGGYIFNGGTNSSGGSGGGGGNGVAGTANTGGGGGGHAGLSGNGYKGGSGIVIIKYSSGVNATGGTITTVWTEEV